jgi:hypothetical protein
MRSIQRDPDVGPIQRDPDILWVPGNGNGTPPGAASKPGKIVSTREITRNGSGDDETSQVFPSTNNKCEYNANKCSCDPAVADDEEFIVKTNASTDECPWVHLMPSDCLYTQKLPVQQNHIQFQTIMIQRNKLE